MNSWRNTILGSINLHQLNTIEPGSQVKSDIDLFDPKGGKKVFEAGKPYRVIRLHPVESPKGMILDSLLGEWYVGIEGEYGGGEYFSLVLPEKLTPDEALGELGSTPFELMKIINQYKVVSRENLYRELIFRYKVIDRAGKQDIIKLVNNALELLETTGLIETTKRPGYYKLTHRGLGELQGRTRKED